MDCFAIAPLENVEIQELPRNTSQQRLTLSLCYADGLYALYNHLCWLPPSKKPHIFGDF